MYGKHESACVIVTSVMMSYGTIGKRMSHKSESIGVMGFRHVSVMSQVRKRKGETCPNRNNRPMPPPSTSILPTLSSSPSHSPTPRFVNSHAMTHGHTPSMRCCGGLKTLASTQRCRAYVTSCAYKTPSSDSWTTCDDKRGGW